MSAENKIFIVESVREISGDGGCQVTGHWEVDGVVVEPPPQVEIDLFEAKFIDWFNRKYGEDSDTSAIE